MSNLILLVCTGFFFFSWKVPHFSSLLCETVDCFYFFFIMPDFDLIFKPLCLGVPVGNRWLTQME